MKQKTIAIYKRDFSGVSLPPPGRVAYKLNSASWNILGGCSEASISVTGNRTGLWEMMEYLRCPVEIYDERGKCIWWGYVSEVAVREGAIEVGATLASMTNRVAVTYSYVEPGTSQVGTRKTTAWAEDADSIAEYGYKEFISSCSGLSDAAATQRRDTVLNTRKWPQGVGANPRGRVRYSGADDSLSATLICKGWMSTLDWRYASWSNLTAISYLGSGSTEQAVGSASTNTKVVQQIMTASGRSVRAADVGISARKYGSPTDNLVLELFALDASGNPTGSALASYSLAGSGLTTSLAWYSGALTAQVALASNTLYGFQVRRSGSADGTNYYAVLVNTGLGYASGAFKIWNGSAWAARSPDADMSFRVGVDNQVETTQQIKDLVGTYGQFITSTDIETASGYYLPSWRDGSRSALEEIKDLLKYGGPNDRSLIALVESDRRLRIYEEEAQPSTPAFYLKTDGTIMNAGGGMQPDGEPPVGRWIKLAEVIPGTVDITKLIDPSWQFVTGARWSAGNGTSLEFRGQPSIEDTLRLADDGEMIG